jgi:hypothetical protein
MDYLSSAQYEVSLGDQASKSVAKASDFEFARCNKEGDYLRHSIKLFLDALSSKSYEKLSFLKSHDENCHRSPTLTNVERDEKVSG